MVGKTAVTVFVGLLCLVAVLGASLYFLAPWSVAYPPADPPPGTPMEFTEAPGRVAHYWAYPGDEKSKVLLIYLAGGPGSRMTITDYVYMKTIAQERPFALLELPGMGSTPRREVKYDVSSAVTTVQSFMRLTKSSDIVLVGYSFGAALATRVAACRPPSLRGVVLLAPGPFPIDKQRSPSANTSSMDGVVELAPDLEYARSHVSEYSPNWLSLTMWVRKRWPVLAERMIPSFKQYEWDENGLNMQANVEMWYSHTHSPTRVFPVEKVEQSAILFHGDLDQKSNGRLEGYYAVFPDMKVQTLKDTDHNLNVRGCEVLLPVWNLLAPIESLPPIAKCALIEEPASGDSGGFVDRYEIVREE